MRISDDAGGLTIDTVFVPEIEVSGRYQSNINSKLFAGVRVSGLYRAGGSGNSIEAKSGYGIKNKIFSTYKLKKKSRLQFFVNYNYEKQKTLIFDHSLTYTGVGILFEWKFEK